MNLIKVCSIYCTVWQSIIVQTIFIIIFHCYSNPCGIFCIVASCIITVSHCYCCQNIVIVCILHYYYIYCALYCRQCPCTQSIARFYCCSWCLVIHLQCVFSLFMKITVDCYLQSCLLLLQCIVHCNYSFPPLIIVLC